MSLDTLVCVGVQISLGGTEEGNKGCKHCSLWTVVVVFKVVFPDLVCKSNACLLLEMHVTVRIQQRSAKSCFKQVKQIQQWDLQCVSTYFTNLPVLLLCYLWRYVFALFKNVPFL